ncbi:MAG: SMC-Scp complex subunit ScpB [Phycisphaera sp.]|nr:MAG: SMC-Scp complex subunit ScpB [Phycisphaera sp.]
MTAAADQTDAAQAPAILTAGLEAILLAAGRAVPAEALWEALALSSGAAEFAGERKPKDILETLAAQLNDELEAQGRPARAEKLAGGYRLMVAPQYGSVVATFDRNRQSTKLSRASIETLSIIAYRQPMTRAQVEAIRGVACGEVLRSLLERKLVAIKGRAEEVGRPILYGTTPQFLELFGLASLKDLPGAASQLKT